MPQPRWQVGWGRPDPEKARAVFPKRSDPVPFPVKAGIGLAAAALALFLSPSPEMTFQTEGQRMGEPPLLVMQSPFVSLGEQVNKEQVPAPVTAPEKGSVPTLDEILQEAFRVDQALAVVMERVAKEARK